MLGIAQSATDRFLRSIAGWLQAAVHPAMLPQGGALGCGHYGCVYATGSESIVLKVTTDPTEANFVQIALQLGGWPEGIVQYHNILLAPDAQYRGRPVYLIWREAAFDVGKVFHTEPNDEAYDQYMVRTKMIARRRLDDFRTFAACARQTLQRAKDREKTLCAAQARSAWAWNHAMEIDWDERVRQGRMNAEAVHPFRHWKGADRVAWCLAAAKATLEQMANEPVLDQVGSALAFYLDRGLLLADVHANNIGKVRRGDYTYIVITDPGHLSDLREMVRCP